jgi:hypothetical protein
MCLLYLVIVSPVRYGFYAADRSSAGARAREGRIGCCEGRLAEACSARERPARGGRWCGLNDRTLTCEVVLWVGHKATKPPNNIRYGF